VDANILKKVDYYDIKGKSILKTTSKFYSGDLGILSSATDFEANQNRGFKLENLVYLELCERYEKVYTYKMRNKKEIDFVCLNEGVITYYQVTELLIDQNELNTN
jgi:predicted AAA+ superfamily ATPase